MSTPRRRFGTDQKATILKRYLVDKVPISDLCDEYGIKPNQIYTWAEDRAPVGTDPSADPGVVSEERAVAMLPPTSLAYNTHAENPSTTK